MRCSGVVAWYVCISCCRGPRARALMPPFSPVPLLITIRIVSDVMSPSRARRGCESTTHFNSAMKRCAACGDGGGCDPACQCWRLRNVPMKTVASLHGPAFAPRRVTSLLPSNLIPGQRDCGCGDDGVSACACRCALVLACTCICVCWCAARLRDDSGLRRTTRLTLPRDDFHTFCFLTDSRFLRCTLPACADVLACLSGCLCVPVWPDA